MSTHKHIDRLLWGVTAMTLVLALVFCCGPVLGIQAADRVMGYENRLFDTSRVHTVEIFMEDWEGFLQTCTDEEYVTCSLVIDNEAYKNVALRAKGNTSLSSVKSYGNDRYSFKVEFDHYDSGASYHGLDKLCLNNLIQDNTLMKDYLVYQLMGQFGAAAPLCSYVWVTVNGEPWGLYLAVEGVEDSFLQRNYGTDHGELYKPDTMNMGGGRGNGKDFDMDALREQMGWGQEETSDRTAPDRTASRIEDTEQQPGTSGQEGAGTTQRPQPGEMGGNMGNMGGMMGGFGGMGGGMGSSQTLLQYTDDQISSYGSIFSSAKTDLTEADQTRLIQALKTLDSENALDAVDADAMLRYFVVHNFVVNGDSYTGSIVHNYYLYEEDGRLSMLPWDYNLAFGSFQASSASSSVNDPIDTPLSVSGDGRPAIDWIFADEENTRQYHAYFDEFLTEFVESGWLQSEIARVGDMIDPYVQQDENGFCSYQEFTAGVETMAAWCDLRAQSVRGQLDGTIPATDAGQKEDSSALVDVSGLNQSAMGSMGGMGGFGGGDRGEMGGDWGGRQPSGSQSQSQSGSGQERPSGGWGNMTVPEGWDSSCIPGRDSAQTPTAPDKSGGAQVTPTAAASGGWGNMTMPEGFDFGNMTMPEGVDPGSMTMPEGVTPGQNTGMPGGSWGGSGGTSAQSTGTATLPLLLLSCAVLLFGLLFAALFKGKR